MVYVHAETTKLQQPFVEKSAEEKDSHIQIFRPKTRVSESSSLPRPPNSPMDRDGLRERVRYANNFRKFRKITPRFEDFLNMFKEKCEKAISLIPAGRLRPSRRRKDKDIKCDTNLENEIKICQGMIESRLEESELLFSILKNSVLAMKELRLQIDYGDYTAINLAKAKTDEFKDFLWRIKKVDWVTVNNELKAERESLEQWELKRNYMSPPLPLRPATPWHEEAKRAAKAMGIKTDQFIFEIDYYATRNEICHSGIQNMIRDCRFVDLGRKILEDKESLNDIFSEERSREQIQLRVAIGRVQNEHFSRLEVNTRAPAPFTPQFRLTESAQKREDEWWKKLED